MAKTSKQSLIRILQNAHAGELAAAYAYRGHWKSVRDEDQKASIKQIENEEWDHRKCVLKWLEELGAEPKKSREKFFGALGRILGVLCFVSGWFFPMYFAGRLESQNTQEYKDAAAFAKELGMERCFRDLMHMSEKELEHELYFRSVVADHLFLPLMRAIFKWS